MIGIFHNPAAKAIPLLATALVGSAIAQEDPGRSHIGKLEVTVYFATNGDVSAAGDKTQELTQEIRTKLESLEHLKFSHYRSLGVDVQPIFKIYENWAQPLKPSDEILVRFEPRSHPTDDAVLIDLELWLSRKKTLKTDVYLAQGKPLFVLGPSWRGGNLIIQVSLAPK